jgi:hypothetical protein
VLRLRFTSALLLIAYLWPATGWATFAHLAGAHAHACEHHAPAPDQPAVGADEQEADSASCLVCAQLHQFKKGAGVVAASDATIGEASGNPEYPISGDPAPQDPRPDLIRPRAPPFPRA